MTLTLACIIGLLLVLLLGTLLVLQQQWQVIIWMEGLEHELKKNRVLKEITTRPTDAAPWRGKV